jgi:8-amino-7-oxononanoate synthase
MHAAHLTAHKALRSQSPIQGIVVPSNSGVLAVERALVEAGVSAKAIRSPTVPEGSERIRICLHSFNTSSELALLFSAIEPAYANGVING